MIPLDEHYRLHKMESSEDRRDFEWRRAATASHRARRTERIKRRRVRWLERTSLIFATLSGWTGQVARKLHTRAATRRVSAY